MFGEKPRVQTGFEHEGSEVAPRYGHLELGDGKCGWVSTRMMHKSLAIGLVRPLNGRLFGPIGACASCSHG